MNISVKEIVRAYLEANDYDGLYCSDCGCLLTDFAPCGEMGEKCKAGYSQKNTRGFLVGPEKGERDKR